jgi:MFS superfamily sulfate permease-like transporter
VLAGEKPHDWQNVPVEPVPQAEPGLVVYRWGASLYFANAARFEEQVTQLAESDGEPVEWLCVDAVAMGDVDYSGGETLLEINDELKERSVKLVFAGVGDAVRKELDLAGVTAAVGEDAYYGGLDEVVQAYRARAG